MAVFVVAMVYGVAVSRVAISHGDTPVSFQQDAECG